MSFDLAALKWGDDSNNLWSQLRKYNHGHLLGKLF